MALADRTRALEAYLCTTIASLLQRPASDVELTRSLGELGLDSLTGLELQTVLESTLKIGLETSA